MQTTELECVRSELHRGSGMREHIYEQDSILYLWWEGRRWEFHPHPKITLWVERIDDKGPDQKPHEYIWGATIEKKSGPAEYEHDHVYSDHLVAMGAASKWARKKWDLTPEKIHHHQRERNEAG